MNSLSDDLKRLEFKVATVRSALAFLPPQRREAVYSDVHSDDSDNGEGITSINIPFVLHAKDTVLDKQIDELKLSVKFKIKGIGSESLTSLVEPLLGFLERKTTINFDDAIVVSFSIAELLISGFPNRLELEFVIDPVIKANEPRQLYDFPPQFTKTSVSVFCPAGSVIASLEGGGEPQTATGNVVARLNSDARGPLLSISTAANSSTYLIRGHCTVERDDEPKNVKWHPPIRP